MVYELKMLAGFRHLKALQLRVYYEPYVGFIKRMLAINSTFTTSKTRPLCSL